MKTFLKRAIVALLAVTMLLGVVACASQGSSEVNVVIGQAATEIKAGDSIKLVATVTGADDKTVTWSSSDEDVLTVSQEGVVTVVAAPAENKTVSIIATANADTSKKAAHQFTVVKGRALAIDINKKTVNITEGESVQLTATVTGADETGVIWSSENTDFLVVDQNGLVTVAKSPSLDMAIKITATAKADETKKVSCTFYLKKKATQGEVGDLTSAMIAEIGNASVTITGKVYEKYEDYVTNSNSWTNEYDMTVTMQDGKWASRHNAVDNIFNVISSTYLRGDNTVTDANGITGHAAMHAYIDRHNEVVVAPLTDTGSVPTVWEEMHLYNHLSQLDVNKFEFDGAIEIGGKTGGYRYKIEPINEYGDNFYGDDGKVDMTKPAAIDAYLMMRLGVSLTPILNPGNGETIEELYLRVNNGKVDAILFKSNSITWKDRDGEKTVAAQYLIGTLYIGEVGTTEVAMPAPLEGPTGTSMKGTPLKELLEKGLNEIKAATNYTYSLKDTATYTPSSGESEFSASTPVYTMGTGTTVRDGFSATGAVGSIAYVTENAILYKNTIKFDAAYDGKLYKTSYSGYKQIDDGSVSGKPYYDEFSYSSDSDGNKTPAMVGTRRIYGTLREDAMPSFDFSANIFQFNESKRSGNTFIYKFYLVASEISKDVAMQMSKYTYAKNAIADGAILLQISVNEEGHLVETVFPYQISRGDTGYCTSTYSDVGTTELPEGVFNDYVERGWRTEWNQYDTKYYYPNHTTSGWTTATSTKNSEEVMRAVFGDSYNDLPKPGVFMEVFGDLLFGPFFDWNTVEQGGEKLYYDYVTIKTRSENADENSKITDYDVKMAALDAKLGECGYKRSPVNCGVSGTDKVVTYIKNGVLIVVTNNGTVHFDIEFRKVGEWSLKK